MTSPFNSSVSIPKQIIIALFLTSIGFLLTVQSALAASVSTSTIDTIEVSNVIKKNFKQWKVPKAESLIRAVNDGSVPANISTSTISESGLKLVPKAPLTNHRTVLNTYEDKKNGFSFQYPAEPEVVISLYDRLNKNAKTESGKKYTAYNVRLKDSKQGTMLIMVGVDTSEYIWSEVELEQVVAIANAKKDFEREFEKSSKKSGNITVDINAESFSYNGLNYKNNYVTADGELLIGSISASKKNENGSFIGALAVYGNASLYFDKTAIYCECEALTALDTVLNSATLTDKKVKTYMSLKSPKTKKRNR